MEGVQEKRGGTGGRQKKDKEGKGGGTGGGKIEGRGEG